MECDHWVKAKSRVCCSSAIAWHFLLQLHSLRFLSLGDFDIRNGVTSQFSPDPTIITCLQKYKIVTSRSRKSKVNSGDSSITVATIWIWRARTKFILVRLWHLVRWTRKGFFQQGLEQSVLMMNVVTRVEEVVYHLQIPSIPIHYQTLLSCFLS